MAEVNAQQDGETQAGDKSALPLPDQMILTVWYFEGDNECKGPYWKVELDLFWPEFSHTREFGDVDEKGLEMARTWALAYQILKPSLGRSTTEVHRPVISTTEAKSSGD